MSIKSTTKKEAEFLGMQEIKALLGVTDSRTVTKYLDLLNVPVKRLSPRKILVSKRALVDAITELDN